MVTKTINLIVPRGWHELDDKQLHYLFGQLIDNLGGESQGIIADSFDNKTFRRKH